jgi:hypothetical protein
LGRLPICNKIVSRFEHLSDEIPDSARRTKTLWLGDINGTDSMNGQKLPQSLDTLALRR